MTFSIPTLNGSRVTLRAVIPADRETYLAYGGQAEANWGFGGGKDGVRPKTPGQSGRMAVLRRIVLCDRSGHSGRWRQRVHYQPA